MGQNAGKNLLWIGSAGFSVTMMLNALAFFLLQQPASIPLHEQWWSTWFAGYAVWLVICVIGLGLHNKEQNKGFCRQMKWPPG